MKKKGKESRSTHEQFREWVDGARVEQLIHALRFEFIKDNLGESHDFELIEQMVELQVPPPTPLHPRAMGFRPVASMHSTFDGRSQELRILRDRFRRPRLFKLVERQSAGCGRPLPSRRSTIRGTTAKHRKFDLVARRCLADDGQQLSLGTTQEQQDADIHIVKQTRFFYNAEGDVVGCGWNLRDHSSALEILNVLNTASKGRWCSLPHNANTSRVPFWSPWFDPTETGRYFSLPTYLSSRFEVALWNAYHGRTPPSLGLLEKMRGRLSEVHVAGALKRATAEALKSSVLPESQECCPDRSRDSLLWALVSGGMMCDQPTAIDMYSLDSTPLIHFNSSRDKFYRVLSPRFQEELVLLNQIELLSSFSTDPASTRAPSRTKNARKKKKRKVKKPRQDSEPRSSCHMFPVAEERYSEVVDGDFNALLSKPTKTDAPSLERTRIFIMVGQIVEELVENAIVVVDHASHCENEEQQISSRNSAEVDSLGTIAEGIDDSSDQFVNEVQNSALSPLIPEKTASRLSELNADAPVFEYNARLSPIQAPEISIVQPPGSEGRLQGSIFPNSVGPVGMAWNFDGTFDELERMKGYQQREKSVFAELFLIDQKDASNEDDRVASSTAASIASSSDKASVPDDNNADNEEDILEVSGTASGSSVRTSDSEGLIDMMKEQAAKAFSEIGGQDVVADPNLVVSEESGPSLELAGAAKDQTPAVSPPASPSPPQTPSPQLSPILVSLADLKHLRERAPSIDLAAETPAQPSSESPKANSLSAMGVSGSLPNSPTGGSTKTFVSTKMSLAQSWSREDLRISSFVDDHKPRKRKGRLVTRQADALLSYRDAVAISKLTPKSVINRKKDESPQVKDESPGQISKPRSNHKHRVLNIPSLDPNGPKRDVGDSCAQSETALETHGEAEHWRIPVSGLKDEIPHITTTRDGSTTVSSVMSHGEHDDSQLLEERNMFRDMCLTLGAEVGKLRNLLAAQQGLSNHLNASDDPFSESGVPVFDHEYMSRMYRGTKRATTTIGAMSDAGMGRMDQDSAIASEDGSLEVPQRPRSVHVKRVSSNGTAAASDVSVGDFGVSSHVPLSMHSYRADAFGSVHLHGLHSTRLTKDIINFLNATKQNLCQLDGKKQVATQRLSRLVKALWPRAQVKLYGSHMTGLSLPSSDMDFVICLPAVHKNAPAVAPGVLEGRNAINESSQKMLARKLKGESWIDPTSIKVIERTVVPVIKLSTKDTRVKMVHLDISFDSPEHHGLEAVELVTAIMKDFPMVQPLVLLLKQFLHDRGLLTAYTGGLSSYCLFLMVTRFLQEQISAWVDCGSLLMGYLDFYGNSFDPRTTGISVGRQQYFARQYNAHNSIPLSGTFPGSQAPGSGRPVFDRRHSFSDKGNVDPNGQARRSPPELAEGSNVYLPPPSRFLNPYPAQDRNLPFSRSTRPYSYDPTQPYTLDPLFVEDPLASGNNVGRNAFRIFQVQRAFSDAHRALVASLEWDNDVNHENDYPLLKCLLQSEDVVFDLEDAHR